MSTNPGEGLSRSISIRNLFSLAFGAIVGTGWIVVAGDWLARAGSIGAIAAFVVGGALTILVGLCYAEIATAIPATGGEVAYARLGFGQSTAFAVGWFLTLLYIAVVAFEAISIGWLTTALFPAASGPVLFRSLGADQHLGDLVLGLGGMAIVTWLNYVGTRSAAAAQDWLVALKLIFTAAFVGAAFAFGSTVNLEPEFNGAGVSDALGGFFAVLAMTPFWFAGFGSIAQAMGEKERGRLSLVVPLVIIVIAASTIFYALVIAAAAVVVPRSMLLNQNLPVADVMGIAGASGWRVAVILAGIAGLAATWNVMFFMATRVLFALGREGDLPTWFGKAHPRYGTPSNAILFVGFVASGLTLLGRSFINPAIATGGVVVAGVFLLVAILVLRLRRTRPDLERPYRTPGGRTIPLAAAAYAVCMLGLALRQSYLDASGGIPVELVLLGGWALVGALFWQVRARDVLHDAQAEVQ
jgi:amino acid transporter